MTTSLGSSRRTRRADRAQAQQSGCRDELAGGTARLSGGVTEWGMEEDVAAPSHEVVAALVVRAARVLLCHRSPERAWYPDTWDLPGGHVEAGEVPRHALARELLEDLGIVATVPSGPEFARLVAADYDCRVWIVTEWTVIPTNLSPQEHDELSWCSLQAIPGLRLAHPDYPGLIGRALT
jgi:8-oxo-dGTP diphosphatase